MKKNYLFFLFAFLVSFSYSQMSSSEDIQSELGIVSSNVASGEKAIYIEDLKHHIKLSKAAIKNVINNLKASNCKEALELCNEISGILDSAEFSNDLKGGRAYLTNVKPLIVKAFYQYDICTINETNYSTDSNSNNEALTNLQQQQSDLKQQQIQLEKKAEEIKRKLAEQQTKESQLKKQKFIALNEKATATNLKAYNDLLKACNCNTSIYDNRVPSTDLSSKSIDDIKTYFLNKVIRISESYIDKLNLCKN